MVRNQRSMSGGIGRGAGDRQLHWSRPSSSRTVREGDGVEELVGGELLVGRRAPGHLLPDGRAPPRPPRRTSPSSRGRPPAPPAPRRRTSPSTRGTPNMMLGRVCGAGGGLEQRGLGTGRDLVAEQDQPVVRHHALGDVGHRQVRHDPHAEHRPHASSRRTAMQRLDGPAQVAVGEHHALGVAGGAGRVDDRGQVVGRADERRPRRGRWDRPRSGRPVADHALRQVARRAERTIVSEVGELSRGPSGSARGSRRPRRWRPWRRSGRPGTRPGPGPTSCRSRRAWRRRTARRGRASGTRGCCASSARPGRPGRPRATGARPRHAPRGRPSSSKVISTPVVVADPATAGPSDEPCWASVSRNSRATVWPSTRSSMSACVSVAMASSGIIVRVCADRTTSPAVVLGPGGYPQ